MDNAFITNVFVTITFFLPGFIAKWTSNYMNGATNDNSELEKTIVALSWNVPPIFIAWITLSLKEDHWQLKNFLSTSGLIAEIQKMPCMLYYFIFALIWAFIIGRLIERIARAILTRLIAKNREKNGLPNIVDTGLAWERFIGAEEEVVLKTYPIADPTKAVVGTLRSAYRPGDIHKGVTLEMTDKSKLLLPYLVNPERTFIDFESQLVFEIYLTDHVTEAISQYSQDSTT